MPVEQGHGTRHTYQAGCPCFLCRLANAAYQVVYRQRSSADPWIDAAPVRAHLQALAAANCGTRHVARLTGCSRSVLQAIRSGARTRMRQSDALLVLAVESSPAMGTCVSAWQTKRWIRALLAEDYTKRRLAEQLGLRSRQLPPQTTRVRRSTEARMQQTYQRLTAEGPDLNCGDESNGSRR